MARAEDRLSEQERHAQSQGFKRLAAMKLAGRSCSRRKDARTKLSTAMELSASSMQPLYNKQSAVRVKERSGEIGKCYPFGLYKRTQTMASSYLRVLDEDLQDT